MTAPATTTTAAFQSAMAAAGIEYHGAIIADGQLHRVKINGDSGPNGWYVLHGDGLPAGMFGCWKRGIRETWCAKADTELTEAERAERDRRWKQQQEIREAERRRQQDDAARTAEGVLSAAQPATDDHPYLKRKRVQAHPGVMVGSWPQRNADNCLLIPLRTASGKLASVQAIFSEKSGDRDKDFLKGGAKTGAYLVIGDLDASDKILIAEGYATAATLHEVTGHAAVMACDAGNLRPVAQAIRALYPVKSITVCADNDRKTDGNPGLTKATAAAKSIKASLAVPEFQSDEAGTDFNDLAGINAERVLRAIADATEPRAEYQAGTVNAGVELKTKRGEIAPSFGNAVRVLQVAEFGKNIAFNEFAGRIQRIGTTPWANGAGDWTDNDTSELMLWASERHHVDFPADTTERAIALVARRNAFNPAQDRLRALAAQWDKKPRLSTWLADYLSAESDKLNREYLAEIGGAWLKGVTARVLQPGCKRDDVLVLVGVQGFGKSTAAAAIADAICPSSFTDSLGNLGTEEAANGIRGVTIAEFSELSAIARSELEATKAFVSRSSDRFREKYARHPTDHPRTCSFIATTNEDCGFLRDPSGNRRWWPVTVAKPIDSERLKVVLPELLGEAAHRVLAGEAWHVTDSVALKQANEIREDNSERDVWEAAVLNALDTLLAQERTISKVLDFIGIKVERQDRQATNRVSAILRMNGWKRKRGRLAGGGLGYLWICSPKQMEGEQEGNSTLASQQADCSPVPICSPQEKNNFEADSGKVSDWDGNTPARVPGKFNGNRGEQGEQGEQTQISNSGETKEEQLVTKTPHGGGPVPLKGNIKGNIDTRVAELVAQGWSPWNAEARARSEASQRTKAEGARP